MPRSVSNLPHRLVTVLILVGTIVVTLVLLRQPQHSNPTGAADTTAAADTTTLEEDLMEMQATVLQALVHRWKVSLAPDHAATILCARNGILCPDECEHWHYFRRYVSGWIDRAEDEECLDSASTGSSMSVDEDAVAVSVAATSYTSNNAENFWRRPIYNLCDPELQNRSAILMCDGDQVNWDYFNHGGQYEQDCISSDVWVRLVHGWIQARTVVSFCAHEEDTSSSSTSLLLVLQLWANAVAPIVLQDETPCEECQAHHILARDTASWRLFRKYPVVQFRELDYYVCRLSFQGDGREWIEMTVPHNETVDPELPVGSDCVYAFTANTPEYDLCDEEAEGLAMCNDNGTLNTTYFETLGYPGQDCTSANYLGTFIWTPWMIHTGSLPCDGLG